MTFQTKTETITAHEVPYELDADTGLTDEAKQALAGAAAAGGVIEKRTTYAEVSPTALAPDAQFALAFLDNFLALLDSGISPQEMKVAAYVLKKMEYGNLVCLSQTAVAREFGISRQQVNKHFKALEKKGFFVKQDGHLFVNSTIFVKGLSTRMDADRRANVSAAHDTRAGKYKPTLKARSAR